MLRVLIIAVLAAGIAAAVVLLTRGHGSGGEVHVVVQGRREVVRSDDTLGEVASGFGLRPLNGDLLDVRGRVLRRGVVAGALLLDGEPSPASTRVEAGERIRVRNGRDRREPILGFQHGQANMVYEWVGEDDINFRVTSSRSGQELLATAPYWTLGDAHCCPVRPYRFTIGLKSGSFTQKSPSALLGPAIVDEIEALKAGRHVSFRVIRAGRTLTFTVRLGSIIDPSAQAAEPPSKFTILEI